MKRIQTLVASALAAGIWLVASACGSSADYLTAQGSSHSEKCQYCLGFCCTNPAITNCCASSQCFTETGCDDDGTPIEGEEEGGVGSGDDGSGGGGGDDSGGFGDYDSGSGSGGSLGSGGGGGGCSSPPPEGDP